MSSYIWWAAQQVARHTSVWVAAHPTESSLIGVGLANAKTRGFVWDVIKATAWRTIQFKGRLTADIARAAAARSTIIRNTASVFTSMGRFIARHPVAAVAVGYTTGAATAIALAKDPDPLTEQLQMRGTSSGIGGTGQPNLGSFPILGSGF